MIGDNWQDLGVIFSGSYDSRDPSVLGNGIVVFGDNAGHIFRSTDYGTIWNDLGAILTDSSYSSSYLENGIVIMGSGYGDMFRSTDYGGIIWELYLPHHLS